MSGSRIKKHIKQYAIHSLIVTFLAVATFVFLLWYLPLDNNENFVFQVVLLAFTFGGVVAAFKESTKRIRDYLSSRKS